MFSTNIAWHSFKIIQNLTFKAHPWLVDLLIFQSSLMTTSFLLTAARHAIAGRWHVSRAWRIGERRRYWKYQILVLITDTVRVLVKDRNSRIFLLLMLAFSWDRVPGRIRFVDIDRADTYLTVRTRAKRTVIAERADRDTVRTRRRVDGWNDFQSRRTTGRARWLKTTALIRKVSHKVRWKLRSSWAGATTTLSLARRPSWKRGETATARPPLVHFPSRSAEVMVQQIRGRGIAELLIRAHITMDWIHLGGLLMTLDGEFGCSW